MNHTKKTRKSNNRKRVEKWLTNNQRFINITGFEREIKAPKGVVQKFLKYGTELSEKHVDPLHEIIKGVISFRTEE
jgi:hypothetical protein